MVKTISDALGYGSEQLKRNNMESFLADSLILLCHTLNCDKTYLLIHKNDIITEDDFEKYKKYIEKRKNNMPVKYITGSCEFMSLDFIVNENVLIPRPDTEILVEAVISENKAKKIKILDLCCGSGCIGISLAYYLKNSEITMVDISEKALEVTEKNIKKHKLTDRIKIIKADILNEMINEKFDVIVSNPPYINEEDYNNLDSDVRDYEPKIALLSEEDEYKFYKRIIDDYSGCLCENGKMYLEMGYNQSEFLKKYMENNKLFKNIEIIKDYGGINRVLKGEMRCKNEY